MEGLRRREKKERFQEIEKVGAGKETDAPKKSDKPDKDEAQSYSEHYSRTKDFIKKIDEIQISAFTEPTEKSATDTEKKIFPEKVAPSYVAPLSRILKKLPGIMEYGIFDKKDYLYTRYSKSGSFKRINPAVCHELAQSIEDQLQRGHFQHLIIREKDNRYILFSYGCTRIIAAVNPDFKANHFMKKLKKKNPKEKSE
jgi:hypothetical protein